MGRLEGYLTRAEARAYPCRAAEQALLAVRPMRSLVGHADRVRRQTDEVAAHGQVDDVMITTRLRGREDHERMLRHLAQAFGLEERCAPDAGTAPAALHG